MKRELRKTEDGSHTLFVPELNEAYHSVHGAVQESQHVFISQGFLTVPKKHISILEIGFGTGLNALLSLAEAERLSLDVQYHGIEKYPLDFHEYSSLNYEEFVHGIRPGSLLEMHESPWEHEVSLGDHFTLIKSKSDIRAFLPLGPYDLVYFDAFAPEKQAQLWTEPVFCSIARALNPGGVLVSYTSKGSVRRALISCQFDVKKVPGPPGKWEMIRATRS